MQTVTNENTVIKFTADMAENLMTYFTNYQTGGVVAIESNHLGLWFVNPNDGSRQFLGKAAITTRNATGVFKSVEFNKQ
ncbi:hypothetical protein BFP76_12085 [Amylibacter kogurei]|uniref:Uncharacterized protein n=1 Tax=Paramylibacter kogurei TaxID=1889778 RepID=A0A2G5KDC9_9RHOB|nr:hypothetical protein [Amylibacter kogurei]PIB26624.1 hypothetical protein BFP76_12085 [Amylibacter kogurei]